MVVSHDSCNLWNDIPVSCSSMFLIREIVQKFSLGETKSRYTVFYGIFPEFKKTLIYDINKSPFYTISYDESLKSEMQMCQMDAGFRYWKEKKNIVGTRYCISKFIRRPNEQSLIICKNQLILVRMNLFS